MFGAMLMRSVIKSFLGLAAILAAGAQCHAASEQLLLHSQQLSNLPGVSGYEEPVRQYVIKHLESLKGSYRVDGMGNVLFHLGQFKPERKTVLLMAHMDEVGFIVKEVDEHGFIRVIPVGGWATHVLWEQQWLIQTSKAPLPAVSGMDSLHVVADYRKVPEVTIEQFYLDTGLTRQELIARGVHPGISVVPDFKFKPLGHYFQGKALDDRLGVAVLLSLASELDAKNSQMDNPFNLVFAFTTQEELGARGARVIADRIKPDVVLNLESGIAHDYPMQFTSAKGPKLGGGPALFIYDGSMLPSHSLVECLAQVAEKSNISFQWESEHTYSQDGSSVQQSGQGSAVVNIGIPVRYVHSHAGVFDYKDLRETKELLWSGLSAIPMFLGDKPCSID